MKTYTLEELTDKHIGKKGTPEREAFEAELRLDLLGATIRQIRKEQKLTQEALGSLVGVKKAQISRIEHSLTDARFDTVLKVFRVLNAKIFFRVEYPRNTSSSKVTERKQGAKKALAKA